MRCDDPEDGQLVEVVQSESCTAQLGTGVDATQGNVDDCKDLYMRNFDHEMISVLLYLVGQGPAEA